MDLVIVVPYVQYYEDRLPMKAPFFAALLAVASLPALALPGEDFSNISGNIDMATLESDAPEAMDLSRHLHRASYSSSSSTTYRCSMDPEEIHTGWLPERARRFDKKWIWGKFDEVQNPLVVVERAGKVSFPKEEANPKFNGLELSKPSDRMGISGCIMEREPGVGPSYNYYGPYNRPNPQKATDFKAIYHNWREHSGAGIYYWEYGIPQEAFTGASEIKIRLCVTYRDEDYSTPNDSAFELTCRAR